MWFGRRPQVAPIERHLPLGNLLVPLRSVASTRSSSAQSTQSSWMADSSRHAFAANRRQDGSLPERQSVRPLMPIPSPPLPFGETKASKSIAATRVAPTENATPTTLIEYSPAASERLVETPAPSQRETKITTVPITPPSFDEAPSIPRIENSAIDVPPRPMRRHRIVEGDTLEAIAQFYYRDSGQASALFAANRSVLQQPDLLPLGVKLILPGLPANSASPATQVESGATFSEPTQDSPRTELVPIQHASSNRTGP